MLQPKVLIINLQNAAIRLQHSFTEEMLCFMQGVQLFGKPMAIYHFAIQADSQISNLAKHTVMFTVA